MSFKSTLKRFIKIIDFVKLQNHPSQQQICSYLEQEGFMTSVSTFKRDLVALDIDFSCVISYHSSKKGYYFNEEESISSDTFQYIINLLETADIIQETIKENRTNLDFIAFENSIPMKGTELLPELLKAIRNKEEVEFTHINFETKKRKSYFVQPYGLKEYQKRWYVIGIPANSTEIRTFGLDRISDLKLAGKSFKTKANFHPLEEFDHIVGLKYSEHAIQKITLSISPFLANYVKTLPIHSSQKFTVETEQECIVELFLKPNQEFINKVLSFGSQLILLEPEWLKTEIKLEIKKMGKGYEVRN